MNFPFLGPSSPAQPKPMLGSLLRVSPILPETLGKLWLQDEFMMSLGLQI